MARRREQDETEQHTEFFGFQVTPSHRAEFEKRAGYSPSVSARIVLLSDLKAPAPHARDPAAMRALRVEISGTAGGGTIATGRAAIFLQLIQARGESVVSGCRFVPKLIELIRET